MGKKKRKGNQIPVCLHEELNTRWLMFFFKFTVSTFVIRLNTGNKKRKDKKLTD